MIIIQPATGSPPFPPIVFGDAVMSEKRKVHYNATKRRIEAHGVASDYLAEGDPQSWSIEARFTATPLGGPYDPDRPRRMFDTLVSISAQRQPVAVSTLSEDLLSVWITKLDRSRSAGDGEQELVTMELVEVRTTTLATTTVRLAPKPARRVPKKGGAAAGKPAAPGVRKSHLAGGYDATQGKKQPFKGTRLGDLLGSLF